MSQPSEKQIFRAIIAAQDRYEIEGEIEIDDPGTMKLASLISAADDWKKEGGFYVMAWVWVDKKEIL